MVDLARTYSIESALREENDLLREQVRQLEELLKPRHMEDMARVYAASLGISPSEARLLFLLNIRDNVSREQYAAAISTEDVDSEKLLSVRIHMLRKKLFKFQITVGTTRGQGYYLPTASKKNLQAAVADWIARGRPVTNPYTRKREVFVP